MFGPQQRRERGAGVGTIVLHGQIHQQHAHLVAAEVRDRGYQGEPEGGTVVDTATIRGIDKHSGGHGWFSWQAPTLPGTYKLTAYLHEAWNDTAPGNNTADVEIVVEPGPKLRYRAYLGAITTAPK